jgi:hypothetical protein
MGTLGFLIAMVVVYAVLQVVALMTLTGVRWRLAFGVAIPAAACAIIGIVGLVAGAEMAPVYFLLFAPIGAACLALLLGAHVLANLRRR